MITSSDLLSMWNERYHSITAYGVELDELEVMYAVEVLSQLPNDTDWAVREKDILTRCKTCFHEDLPHGVCSSSILAMNKIIKNL